MKHIFICERPTQIITALEVCNQLADKDETEILVAERFDDAQGIVERFSKMYPAVNFTLKVNYTDAINFMFSKLPASVYIHWDMGFRTQFWLARARSVAGTRISVFEEGIGTYRQDIYPSLKRKIFCLFRIPVNIGGSKHIDEIFVYNKSVYSKVSYKKPLKVTSINRSLAESVLLRENELIEVFGATRFLCSIKEQMSNRCNILLSNWNFSATDLALIYKTSDTNIVKFHPHCEERVLGHDLLNAPRSMPAELLLLILSRLFPLVFVYHYGSSVEKYIKEKNITFIDMSKNEKR